MGLSQVCLRLFRPVSPTQLDLRAGDVATITAILKCLIVLGILMTGLSLTIGKIEASWTGIQYFSCSSG